MPAAAATSGAGPDRRKKAYEKIQPRGAIGNRKNSAAVGYGFDDIWFGLFSAAEHKIVLVDKLPAYQYPPDKIGPESIGKIGQRGYRPCDDQVGHFARGDAAELITH